MNPLMLRVVAIICSLAAVVIFSYRHGVLVTDTAWQAKHNGAVAEANARAAAAESRYREIERQAAKVINEIEAKHHEENQIANAEYDRRVAALRAGTLRLRDRFTCPGTGNKLPGAAASPGSGQPASGAGLQPQDAEFFISEAKRADEITRQLTACQDIIRADRVR